jgi:hypothetical protein
MKKVPQAGAQTKSKVAHSSDRLPRAVRRRARVSRVLVEHLNLPGIARDRHTILFTLAVATTALLLPHTLPTVVDPPAIIRPAVEKSSFLVADYLMDPTPKTKMSKAQLAQQKQKKQQKLEKQAQADMRAAQSGDGLGVSLFQSFDPSFDKQAARAKAVNAAAAARAAAEK